jgi:hypothetical protein
MGILSTRLESRTGDIDGSALNLITIESLYYLIGGGGLLLSNYCKYYCLAYASLITSGVYLP